MKQLKTDYKMSKKNTAPFGAKTPENTAPFGAKILHLLGQNTAPFGANGFCNCLYINYLQSTFSLIIILIKDLIIFNYIETALKNFWIFEVVSLGRRRLSPRESLSIRYIERIKEENFI